VVITGREDIRSIDRAYALGATSFVAKPVNWRLLSHQLKYVLRMDTVARQTRLDRDHFRRVSAFKTDLLRLLSVEASNTFRSFLEMSQTLNAARKVVPALLQEGTTFKRAEAVTEQFYLKAHDLEMLARFSDDLEEHECAVPDLMRLACEGSQHPKDIIETSVPDDAAAIRIRCDAAWMGRLLALALDSASPANGRIQFGFTRGDGFAEFRIRAGGIDDSFGYQILQYALGLVNGQVTCQSAEIHQTALLRLPDTTLRPNRAA
jgi:hypothetical protein